MSTERNKPHCFELYSAGNEVIKACKTDSEGKVVEGKQHLWQIILRNITARWKRCVLYGVKYGTNDNYFYLTAGKHTVYRMSASTEEEKEEWIKCIQ